MIAHTPTIFASVAWVALIMAFCLLLVGRFNQRDGLRLAGCGLLSHALAYVCYTQFGHASLWITYLAGNSLLSLALAFYTASIFTINALPVPWKTIFIFPLLMALLLALQIDTTEPRMLTSTTILMLQCGLIILYARRHAQQEKRAHVLLIIGAGISLIGLLIRVAVIVSGTPQDMAYDTSNIKQTISISIGTVTVMMLSLGLVLMSKERTELTLEHMAMRDSLTGIANRRAVIEQLDNEIRRAQRNASSLAIAIIDIDHFKRINDDYGHIAGDMVLCHCVSMIRQRLRQSDQVGRYGGEEFLLVMPDSRIDGAVAALEEMCRSVADNPAEHAHHRIAYTLSAGIWCGRPDANDNATNLIAMADAALYKAKASGRNCVKLSAASTDPQTSERAA